MKNNNIKLKGKNSLDIHTMSSLVQDSITMLKWINLDNNKLVIKLNRFCWEDKFDNLHTLRVSSILNIENVTEVKMINPPSLNNDFNTILSILSHDKNTIIIVLNDGFSIKILGKNFLLKLEDITEKYHTDIVPNHQL